MFLGKSEDGYDIVSAKRVLVNRKQEVLEVDCPNCGKVHTHSLGDGHRVSHCDLNYKGYIIKEDKRSE